MEKIKIKLLSENAILPTRSHEFDAGLDLYAAEGIYIKGKAIVKTDVAVDIPEGYEGQIRPRSGFTSKTNFRVQLGTIDAGYHGPLGVMVDYKYYTYDEHSKDDANYIEKGTKIAQLVIVPIVTPIVEQVDSFDVKTDRGENGFGSTGK